MTIFMDRLDDREKGILNTLNDLVPIIENMYEDMENELRNKDCAPLLKRSREKRDRARAFKAGFERYLILNGEASPN